METKTFKGKIKSVCIEDLKVEKDAFGNRRISGFANTPTKDRSNDIVEVEAFTKTMDSFMKNPIMLLMHNSNKPIGTWDKYEIRSDGLWVSGVVAKGTDDADNAWTLIEQRVLRALSIGFMELDSQYDKADDTYHILELDLFEISVVAVPANQEALFTVDKSGGLKSIEIIETKVSAPEEKAEEVVEPQAVDLVKGLDVIPQVISDLFVQVQEISDTINNKENSKDIEGLKTSVSNLSDRLSDFEKVVVKMVKWEARKLANTAGVSATNP